MRKYSIICFNMRMSKSYMSMPSNITVTLYALEQIRKFGREFITYS